MAYFAKVNIGIPPYEVVTIGEILKDHHIQALGEERLNELVKENALGVQRDASPTPATAPAEEQPEEENAAEEAEQDETEGETVEAAEETGGEETEELALPMDELVNDAPAEDTVETSKKKGRKKKNEDQDA